MTEAQRKSEEGTPKSLDTASTMEEPKVTGRELRSWRRENVRRREEGGMETVTEQPPALGRGIYDEEVTNTGEEDTAMAEVTEDVCAAAAPDVEALGEEEEARS